MCNVDESSSSISRTMFQDMIQFVETYQENSKGRNPYTIPIDSDRTDFVSFNKFQEMLQYYQENSYPTIIPINPENK